ncbi:hypothetical protein NIES2104_30640 [Leptolyngbya sp. NIES-2104]|nr:hypothetical protein NIES2104_30640 [Leptolyngbya sp. NIES-2104]
MTDLDRTAFLKCSIVLFLSVIFINQRFEQSSIQISAPNPGRITMCPRVKSP